MITGVDDELWPGAVHPRPTTLFHRVFRNTVTRESCRKLTDWNSASRYNGYSAWIDRSGSRPPTRMHTPGAHTRAAAARSSLKSFSARAVRAFHPRTELPCPMSEARFLRDRDVSASSLDIRIPFEDFFSAARLLVVYFFFFFLFKRKSFHPNLRIPREYMI